MQVGSFLLNLLKVHSNNMTRKRRKRYPPHGVFTEYINIPYMNDGNPQHTFDIYLAKENRKNCCIIDIHGGTYIFGQHQDNYPFGYPFLENGFDFVTIDYQPNNGKMDMKDLTDDIARNINYLVEHLKDYGLDNDQFVITGDSAGGHFALMFAEALCDKEYAKQLGYDFSRLEIKACLVNGPMYDYKGVRVNPVKDSGLKRMFGPNWADEEARALVCPKTHIGSLSCPLFVSTCKNDFLRVQSLMLQEDMKSKDNIFKFIDLDVDDKNVGHVHNVIEPSLKESVYVNNEMMAFINECLK